MPLTTTTTVTCDCCGYSFADGAAGEIYATISVPGSSSTTVRLYCYAKGCNLHVPGAVTTAATDQATRHVARIVSTAVVAPVAPTLTRVAAGGTHPAATRYWKVSAVNAVGETLASGEASLLCVLNDAVDVTWVKVTGATGYKVYRAGASQTYTTPALVATVGDVATYRDTGSAATAGTLAAANTTVGIPIVATPLTS